MKIIPEMKPEQIELEAEQLKSSKMQINKRIEKTKLLSDIIEKYIS